MPNQEQLQKDVARVSKENKERRDADLRKEYAEDKNPVLTKEMKILNKYEGLNGASNEIRKAMRINEELKEENARLKREEKAQKIKLQEMEESF